MDADPVSSLQFRKASDQSLLIYFDEASTVVAHRRVAELVRAIELEPVPGLRNLHPGFRSVLVKFDAVTRTHEDLETELRLRFERLPAATAYEPQSVEIPVCYGGEFGPDLEAVALLHRITPEEVIARHSGQSYVVFFLGFVPGFAYLGELPNELRTPRLASPRKVVPAGSVGIAGRQTGVYPFATPGGWRLLGRTPLKIFDQARPGMCLMCLGDMVKFAPITRERFLELETA